MEELRERLANNRAGGKGVSLQGSRPMRPSIFYSK